jgi:alpha-glucosidase
VWDETVGVEGEVGKYIVMARRSGEVWYLGALTGWDAQELNINIDFIPEGNYLIEIFRDGINADRAACDYKREIVDLPADRKINVKMAPGGGYAAKIYKK